MPALIRAAKVAIRKALKPYRVVVKGGEFDGHEHRAWDYADALAWARCYPRGLAGEINVTTRFGRWLGRVA